MAGFEAFVDRNQIQGQGAKRRSSLRVSACALAMFATCFGAVETHAQTASQITPQSARPAVRTPSGAIAVPQASTLVAPAGSDKLTVSLAGVSIDGGLPELKDITDAVTAKLSGRTVTVAEIFGAAQELEAAYAAAGYVLVRVVLPEQTLENGDTLHLTVINGFIERVETKNVPERVQRRIASVLENLVGVKPITLRFLERKLLIAAETPGTQLKSTLAAGQQLGGSVLIVETAYRPVGGDIGADNTMSKTLGTWNSTIGAELNSVATLGEQVYARATGYWNFGADRAGFFEAFPRSRSIAGGFTLPIGTDGLLLNLEAVRTETAPRAINNPLSFASVFDRYSARLRYPVIRTRNFSLGSEVALDIEDERLQTIAPLSADVSVDKLRVVRSTSDLSWLTDRGDLITAKLRSSQGLNGLGARRAADATPLLPLSRQGADADFRKIEYSLSYSKLLADHLAIDIRGNAQTSFGDPLPRSEQIGIVGLYELSGFDSGSLQGDQGFVVRGEISSPWSFAVPTQAPIGTLSFTPYAFGAFGGLWLQQPTAAELRITHAQSYGAGFRLGGAVLDGLPQAGLTLEWARQERDDGVREDDRVTFTGSLRF